MLRSYNMSQWSMNIFLKLDECRLLNQKTSRLRVSFSWYLVIFRCSCSTVRSSTPIVTAACCSILPLSETSSNPVPLHIKKQALLCDSIKAYYSLGVIASGCELHKYIFWKRNLNTKFVIRIIISIDWLDWLVSAKRIAAYLKHFLPTKAVEFFRALAKLTDNLRPCPR